MKTNLYVAASVVAVVALPVPAAAQMHMPGMTMPMPQKATPKKKPAARKATAKRAAPEKEAAKRQTTANTQAGSGSHGDMPGMSMPSPPSQTAPTAAQAMPPMDHSTMSQSEMGQTSMGMGEHADHEMAMTGALGPYPMERESSGTAWQPDTSEHAGLHAMNGDWTLMAHGVLDLVYDHQSGPRGDDKAFVSGMLMGMARRPIGNGVLQFKTTVSPDPLMGAGGYPLLLASGETADGVHRLVDRQHPHDFFMEMSASVSQNLGPRSSLFLYAGLPGEPAFGPPAFMHRESIMDSPEAPITHHWLDSTHISFGVLTAGVVLDRVKLEVSRFNGREPDQHRWNIETAPLDSTSVRLSWNPTKELALQGSWGHFKDPEQLEPGVNQKRWSASALYAREIAPGWKLAGTLAWGRKTIDHQRDDAFAAETSLKHSGWTLFGRGEVTENRELIADPAEHGPATRVGKASLGGVRDFRIADHLTLGLGGLFAVNFVPGALSPLYGGRNPAGAMGFVRLKLR